MRRRVVEFGFQLDLGSVYAYGSEYLIRSRIYFARRLRKRRMIILSLSEKVNHISPSVSLTPIDPGYLNALERLGTSYGVVNSIQHSD